MTDRWVFGYGSLVNRATHDYSVSHPATLAGWRRRWVPSSSGHVALLSISPAPGHSIDGLIALVPADDWPALDERERGYDKLALSDIEHSGPSDPQILAYSVQNPGNGQASILLSYLDVVVQGFYRLGGKTGVAAFFDTTDAWATIRNDRAQPAYPRAQTLTQVEHELVNHHIAARALTVDGAALT